jgi:uncharacterized repeat protein (TIGR01451 family)
VERPSGVISPPTAIVSATKTDSFPDPNADGKAEPGDTITYDVNVSNSGAADATGVSFTDTIDSNTTLVAGSLKVSPLAFADTYNAMKDTSLNISAPGVLTNDTGTPAPTAQPIAAGTTTAGGSVTLNADGSFSYTPPTGFTGADSFTYTATNGLSPDDAATVTINVDEGPAVTTTSPTGGAINVAQNSNITVNFSEPVNATTSSFSVQCPTGSPQAFTLSASPASSFTLDPVADLPAGTTCAVTVFANQISDVDAFDPPDHMAADYTFSFGVKPLAVDDMHSATGNVRINTAGSGFSVLSNDQGPGVTITAFDATSAHGGEVTMNTSTGTFTYDPPRGFTGTDSFNYTISNAAGSDQGTVVLTVSDMIWFINNAPGACSAGCDGRLTHPFTSLTAFEAINGNGATSLGVVIDPEAGDNIFIYTGSGNYTGPLTLENNQRVIGQGASSDIPTLTGITLAPDSDALPTTGGTKPTITSSSSGIVLAQNDQLHGLAFSNTTNAAVNGAANVGTLLMSDIAITNTSGAGFDLSGGGTVEMTGTNTVSTTTGASVNFTNTTIGAGNVTFQSVSHNGNNTAVTLTNTGAGQFIVTGTGTTSGSGGTIENTVGADAIRLNNTDGRVILKNMIIEDITASTDASAANDTRSNVDAIHGQQVDGGLNLEGTIIRRISDDGINGSVDAINPTATVWNGLTITNSTIEDTNRYAVSGHGDAQNEGAVRIVGLKGTVSVTGSTIQRAGSGLDIITDTSGSLDMTVQSSSFLELNKEPGGTARVGNFGISVVQQGSLSSVVRIGDPNDANAALGNAFTNNPLASVRVITNIGSTGSMKTEISRNTFTVTDHSSPGLPPGNFIFNIPQGGVLLRALGSGNYEGIFSTNTLDQCMHADGGIGQLSVIIEGGNSEFIVRNNTFKLPWDAPVELRADGASGTQASAAVLFQNNTYVDGTVGSATDDLGGASQSPFSPFFVQVRNNGRLDLTMQNDILPLHDTTSGFANSFHSQTTSAGDVFNLFLQNTKSPLGYRLQAAAGTTFNLYRNGSAAATAQGVLQDNGNRGGGGSDNTNPPATSTSGTTTLSNTAPTLPNITISMYQPETQQQDYLAMANDSQNASPNSAPTASASNSKIVPGEMILAHGSKVRVLRANSATTGLKPTQPMPSGETVNATIGTLPASKTVHIQFQVTVNSPLPGTVTQVSNQGTISGDNFASVLTDDPAAGGSADPTVTPILTPPDIAIKDASVSEPASGSTPAAFAVVLSHSFSQPVMVNFSTANDTGGANPATAGSDYTTTSGTVTFNPGETIQTISVPVLADGDNSETAETFLVNLSGATGGTITDSQAVGTITPNGTPGTVIISELRTSGPAGPDDDFVELLNNTDADIVVAASDASAGWALVKSGGGCSDTPVVVGVIPNGTVIPARGNYLLVGSAYSLSAYAAGDQALSTNIEDDRNVALFNTADIGNLQTGTRLDAVGFGSNTGNNCDLLREGGTLQPASGSTSEYSFVRKVDKGETKDTGDNSADFIVVSTTPSMPVGANTTPTLGAPGPENASSPRGPVPCDNPTGTNKFDRAALDSSQGFGTAPNLVLDTTADAPNNSTYGTIDFRRRFTNNTGGAVTRLRFRIVDMTTAPASPSSADLRARTSAPVTVTGVNDAATCGGSTPCSVVVLGTTLETPPVQALGGGVNSTLAVGTVTLGTPLANGASINLRFLFGVQQEGNYHVGIVIETLTSGSIGKDIWELRGNTQTGGDTDGDCNTPPVANAGADQTIECGGGSTNVTLDGSASFDPDGDTPLSYEWREGMNVLGTSAILNTSLAFGPHTITLKVTDPSGAFNEDTVNVNIVDTTDPMVTAPPNVTVSTGPGATSCGAFVSDGTLGTATASDGCAGPLTPTRSGVPAGNNFHVGQTIITYTANDGHGHTKSAMQTVTVIDNTPPTLSVPPDQTVNAPANSCSANVNPGTATANDNCPGVTVTGTRSDSQPLNAPYPVGTTTITWKATDAANNMTTGTQTITVRDATPPVITLTSGALVLGPPNHSYHTFNIAALVASVSDLCDASVDINDVVISQVTSDEPEDATGNGDGNTNNDIVIAPDCKSVQLRAERSGTGDGRVYKITLKVKDSSGNVATAVRQVTVLNSGAAIDSGVHYTVNGCAP